MLGGFSLRGIDRALSLKGPASIILELQGLIVARHRGDASLPSFVSMARGPIADGRAPMEGHGGGTWGNAFDPFLLNCAADGSVEVPALKLLDNLTLARLTERRALLSDLASAEREPESFEGAPKMDQPLSAGV